MRRSRSLFPIISLLVALPLGTVGCVREATMTAGDRDDAGMAVAQIARAYEAGLNAGDVDAIVALYTPDGVLMNTDDRQDARGTDAIRAALGALLASSKFSGTSITSHGVQVVGDVVVDNGTSTAMVREGDGEPVERLWKWISVSEKQGDGSWKLTRLLVAPVGMMWPAPAE